MIAPQALDVDGRSVVIRLIDGHAEIRGYERLGYEPVGELRDYIIRGSSELIMRKPLGPSSEFRRNTN